MLGVMNPGSTSGCAGSLSGIGTTTVTCVGQGSGSPSPDTRALYDGVVVGADTPSSIGVVMRTNARSAVAFGIMTARIAVTKQVVGRVRASDSFDLFAVDPEGTRIATATTGPADTASTGALTVLPSDDGGGTYTLGEAPTPARARR